MKKIELIGKDRLEAKFQEYLEQRQMPDCFLYLGKPGVNNWLSLSNSPGFPVASRLTDLLELGLPSVAPHLATGFDLVSIGAGNGIKERIILESFGKQVLTYYPVDVSSEMVDEALNTVTDTSVKKLGLVAFLEDLPLLRSFWSPPVLLCLLGNNFCNYEPDYLLETVGSQLESNDLFLFDCHLFPTYHEDNKQGKQQIEQIYRSELNVLFNIDPLVQRGLDPDDCVFHLDLLPCETHLGTIYKTCKHLEILKDTEVSFGLNKVFLGAGETIQLGFTYKYTCLQVQEYLQQHGFQELEIILSSEGDNLLILVQKQPT